MHSARNAGRGGARERGLLASLHVPVASLFDTNVVGLKSTLDCNNAKTTVVTAAAKGTVVATFMEAVAVRLRRSHLWTLQATTWPGACASCAAEGEPNEFREPTRGQPISLLVWNLGLCRPPYRRNGSGDTRGGALFVWGIRHHGGCCGLLSTSEHESNCCRFLMEVGLPWKASRSHVFRNLKRGQRINSFPRTYECTRKDALSRNMNRMSEVHGARHFSFAPRGFVLPAEREALREAMLNTSEGEAWIVKPANSACGRGIYITKNFADMPVGTGADGNWIAQQYVEDPMLLDGLKFDLRLYVAVTSFRPLRVYLHDEGLCRLATETYRPDAPSFGNKFIHLTNYSINRRSNRYEHGKTTDTGDFKAEQKLLSSVVLPPNVSIWSTPTWISSGADELHQSETSVGTAPSQNQSPERAHHGAGCVFFTPPHRPSDGATTDITTEETNGFPGNAASKGSTATPTTMPAGGGTRGCSPNLSTGERKCGDERSAVSIDVTKPTTVEGSTCTGKKESGGSWAGGRRVGGGMGSKWSLKVLRRRLAGMGVDVPALWQDIHSVVIKTLIAIEAQMFGFDVLVDRQQRPHLLEVNFAPSLNTDSDLDLEIKSKRFPSEKKKIHVTAIQEHHR
ncbi:unnamed protein product [Ectocarpus sp. CCAP 1310/34]|nr:unnamed protein product [Ectocarpus sp. CCAP 1310/34]